MPEQEEVKNLLQKYKEKLEKQLGGKVSSPEEGSDEPKRGFSKEYLQFKKEYMPPHLTYYEKLCNISEKIFKISPDKKKAPLIQESINICHLNATPTGVISLSFLAPLFIIIFGSLISFFIFNSFFFVFIFVLVGGVMITPLQRFPDTEVSGGE